MKTYETRSCGYRLTFPGPDTVEEYDTKGGKPGTALEHACLHTIHTRTLPEWQEKFAALLQERTGIPRQIESEATATRKEIPERVLAYNKRIVEEWGNGNDKKAILQQWAQETADQIVVTPPAVPEEKAPPPSRADLMKAQEILARDPAVVAQKVHLMLSEVPGFKLARTAEGLPDPESFAHLLNRFILTKLGLPPSQ
jgi:hypothetical protein